VSPLPRILNVREIIGWKEESAKGKSARRQATAACDSALNKRGGLRIRRPDKRVASGEDVGGRAYALD
jgi:hypothetical protein